MKLGVHERMALIPLLPREGTYEALKSIRVARETISFTPEEIDFYKIKTVTGANGKPATQWDTARATEQIKDIPIDQYITNLISKKLSAIEKKGNLSEDQLSIYDKFVIAYQP